MSDRSLIAPHRQWELLKATELCKQYMAGGMPTEFIGDEELQQKLVEMTLVEQMTNMGYGPKDRREAAMGLAKMKGFGRDSQKKRVLEEIERIRSALEGKTVDVTPVHRDP